MLIKGLLRRFRVPLVILGVVIVAIWALNFGGVISLPAITVAPAAKEPAPGYTEAPYVYPDDDAMLVVAAATLSFMDEHFVDDDNRAMMGYIQYGDLLLAQVRGMCKEIKAVEIWVLAFRYDHESGEWEVENIVSVTTMAEFVTHYERFQQEYEALQVEAEETP